MVLTEAPLHLGRYMQTHEDEDDKLLPESQISQFKSLFFSFFFKSNTKMNFFIEERCLLWRVKELGHLEETPLENL